MQEEKNNALNSLKNEIAVFEKRDIFDIEKKCELKLNDFFILTAKSPKIAQIKNDPNFYQELGVIFTKIAVLSGVKNPIDEVTKNDIKSMISRFFNNLTFEDIFKAFELERYNQYEKKTEHFQLFDCSYISEILKKYQNWKTAEKLKLNFEIPEIEPKISEEEKQKIRSEFLKLVFSEIQNNGFSDDAWRLYNEIENDLKKDFFDFDEYKIKLYKKEKDKYAAEVLAKNSIANAKKIIQNINNNGSLINRCKSILVSNFLKNITDFEEFKNKFL